VKLRTDCVSMYRGSERSRPFYCFSPRRLVYVGFVVDKVAKRQVLSSLISDSVSREDTWKEIFSKILIAYLSQYLTNLMHKICFTVSFISCLYMFRAHMLIIRRSKLHYTASGIITPIGGCLVHRLRESSLKIALHSLWYHHTYRWPSGAQVERRPPIGAMIPEAV